MYRLTSTERKLTSPVNSGGTALGYEDLLAEGSGEGWVAAKRGATTMTSPRKISSPVKGKREIDPLGSQAREEETVNARGRGRKSSYRGHPDPTLSLSDEGREAGERGKGIKREKKNHRVKKNRHRANPVKADPEEEEAGRFSK